MLNKDLSYADFSVGDSVSFTRSFSIEDYQRFRHLSHDTNPLHCDSDYAKSTAFGKMIVPMHLTASPLSYIAGVIFPGHRSLYLNSSVKSLLPVYYDELLTYSASIKHKLDAENVMTISVIVFNSTMRIVMEAELLVQVRSDVPDEGVYYHDDQDGIIKSNGAKVTLITGATGGIGSSIVHQLMGAGRQLILLYHSNSSRIDSIHEKCQIENTKVESYKIDLSAQDSAVTLATFLKARNVTEIIHTAAPPLAADFRSHSQISYSAFKAMLDVSLSAMLSQQYGRVIFMGSRAMETHVSGWEDYVAAKEAGASLLKGLNFHYSKYGVRGVVVSPGLVNTNYSSIYHDPKLPMLVPEYVAERVVDLLLNTDCAEPYMGIDADDMFGGTTISRNSDSDGSGELALSPRQNALNDLDVLDATFRRFFSLSPSVSLNEMGIGRISAWNSLRHIELLLKIEQVFKIKFSSTEIDKTKTFLGIRSLLEDKVAG